MDSSSTVDETQARDDNSRKIDEEAVTKAEIRLFEKVKASIKKRDEVFRLRMFAKRLEGECYRLNAEIYALTNQSNEWYEKVNLWNVTNKFARIYRTHANSVERQAKRIEDGMKGEDSEKMAEFALVYMKDACVQKTEVAKSLRNFARNTQTEINRILQEIERIPPRFEDKRVMRKEVVRQKEEAATSKRIEASMCDKEIERFREKIKEIEAEKAKKLKNSRSVIITKDAPKEVVAETRKEEEAVNPEEAPKEEVAVETRKEEEVVKPEEAPKEEVAVETRKEEEVVESKEVPNEVAAETRKEEEVVKPVKVSAKPRNDKVEDKKTMTLKEYEEKKKAAKFTNSSTSAKVDAGKDGEISKKEDSKVMKKGGKPKKCNVMDVLQVSENSFYRPQHYSTHNDEVGDGATSNYGNRQGRERGGNPRQTHGRNFGGQTSPNGNHQGRDRGGNSRQAQHDRNFRGQRSPNVGKKEEFPELN